MKSSRTFRLSCWAWLLPVVTGLPLHGQNILLTHTHDQIVPVESVRSAVPYGKVNGRMEAIVAGVSLQPAPFYRDGFIEITDFKRVGNMQKQQTSTYVHNHNINFSGHLTASQSLDHCYLVFTTNGEETPQTYTFGLPDLAAGKKTYFNVSLSLAGASIQGRYDLHIFSGTRECLTSRNTSTSDQAVTQSAYLARAADAPPAPFFRVSPSAGVSGRATIRCQIDAEGQIVDASVVKADPQEFGAAAATAVKQWLFTPAVARHQFVAATVDIPVTAGG